MRLSSKSKFASLIAKAWSDNSFKASLINSPEETLKNENFNIPETVKIEVVEDTDTEVHVVIPVKPFDIENAALDLANLTWAYESNSGPSGGSKTGG